MRRRSGRKAACRGRGQPAAVRRPAPLIACGSRGSGSTPPARRAAGSMKPGAAAPPQNTWMRRPAAAAATGSAAWRSGRRSPNRTRSVTCFAAIRREKRRWPFRLGAGIGEGRRGVPEGQIAAAEGHLRHAVPLADQRPRPSARRRGGKASAGTGRNGSSAVGRPVGGGGGFRRRGVAAGDGTQLRSDFRTAPGRGRRGQPPSPPSRQGVRRGSGGQAWSAAFAGDEGRVARLAGRPALGAAAGQGAAARGRHSPAARRVPRRRRSLFPPSPVIPARPDAPASGGLPLVRPAAGRSGSAARRSDRLGGPAALPRQGKRVSGSM